MAIIQILSRCITYKAHHLVQKSLSDYDYACSRDSCGHLLILPNDIVDQSLHKNLTACLSPPRNRLMDTPEASSQQAESEGREERTCSHINTYRALLAGESASIRHAERLVNSCGGAWPTDWDRPGGGCLFDLHNRGDLNTFESEHARLALECLAAGSDGEARRVSSTGYGIEERGLPFDCASPASASVDLESESASERLCNSDRKRSASPSLQHTREPEPSTPLDCANGVETQLVGVASFNVGWCASPGTMFPPLGKRPRTIHLDEVMNMLAKAQGTLEAPSDEHEKIISKKDECALSASPESEYSHEMEEVECLLTPQPCSRAQFL